MTNDLEDLAQMLYATTQAAKTFDEVGNTRALALTKEKLNLIVQQIYKLGGKIETIHIDPLLLCQVGSNTPGAGKAPQVYYTDKNHEKKTINHFVNGHLKQIIENQIIGLL